MRLLACDTVGLVEVVSDALCDLEAEGHALGLRETVELPVDEGVRDPEGVVDPDLECDDAPELEGVADGHALGLRETVEQLLEDALRDPEGVVDPD